MGVQTGPPAFCSRLAVLYIAATALARLKHSTLSILYRTVNFHHGGKAREIKDVQR